MEFQTIAAISTPRGKGGVALLRISGSESIAVAERVFRPADHKSVSAHPARFQIYGSILSPDHKDVIDDGLLTYFSAPHSFTGEDVVEIACHGGETVTAMVLESILANGAVLAGRGEFTRRAFVNGKLSLTAAEGIVDLIDAKTEEAVLLSAKAAGGTLSARIQSLSEKLLAASASLWAYLDYPEEDLQSLDDRELLRILHDACRDCESLAASFRAGRAVNSGVNAMIVGKPNVGKSTFFNFLLGEERAIVTDLPGTTRDRIEYPVKMGRVLLNLADTAGIREDPSDPVERIGIERALAGLERAELVFALFDSSAPKTKDDEILLSALRSLPRETVILPILTKTDLPPVSAFPELASFGEPLRFRLPEGLSVSELVTRIEGAWIDDENAYRRGELITNARQRASLENTARLLHEAIDNISNGQKDVASLTLEAAFAALLETDGQSAGDEILNEIFSRFCVGK